MSFVNQNKTWLLPLLAIGIGAVAWFDLKSFQSPTPAQASTSEVPSPQPIQPPTAQPTAEGVEPSSPPQVPPAPTLGPDAWADLSLYNSPRGDLGKGLELASRATRPLSDAQLMPGPPSLLGTRFDAPELLAHPQAGDGLATPPPPLEFISRTPEGLRAWYQGVGYLPGQTLLGSAFRVREIRPPRVTLEGPSGAITQSTFLLSEPAEARSSKETP